MKKIYILLFIIFIFSLLISEDINFLSSGKNVLLINNGRFFQYQLLKPNDKIIFKARKNSEVEVFSRIQKDVDNQNYQYSILYRDSTRIIDKSVRKSSQTRAVNGDRVSKYNKYVFTNKSDKKIIINNISGSNLLFKINYAGNPAKISKGFTQLEPDRYGSKKILQVDNNNYSYYTADNFINLKIKGPATLKIISRLIFKNHLVDYQNYRYRLFNDEGLIETIETKAHNSRKSILAEARDKIISKGYVKILHLDEKIHNIKLQAPDKNRKLIFNFYLKIR